MIVESIGIIASLFVLACFMCSEEKKMRLFDIVGAFLYVVYGVLKGSFANVFMNTVLICIHIYKFYKLTKKMKG